MPTLQVRHKVKRRPDQSQDDRRSQSAPASLQRIGRVAHPADLLRQGGDEEYDEEHQDRPDRELEARERASQQALDAVGQQVDRRHQQDDREVPDRGDPTRADGARQQPTDTGTPTLTVDQDHRGQEGTDELERAERQPDERALRRGDPRAEQPERNREGERQEEEGEGRSRRRHGRACTGSGTLARRGRRAPRTIRMRPASTNGAKASAGWSNGSQSQPPKSERTKATP